MPPSRKRKEQRRRRFEETRAKSIPATSVRGRTPPPRPASAPAPVSVSLPVLDDAPAVPASPAPDDVRGPPTLEIPPTFVRHAPGDTPISPTEGGVFAFSPIGTPERPVTPFRAWTSKEILGVVTAPPKGRPVINSPPPTTLPKGGPTAGIWDHSKENSDPNASVPKPSPPEEQFFPWKLTPLDLPSPRRTRPPRVYLTPWDCRLRRYTSPRYMTCVPTPLSPLPPSPRRPARCEELGIQSVVETHVASTQTPGWETSPEREDNGPWGPPRLTQTEPRLVFRERRQH